MGFFTSSLMQSPPLIYSRAPFRKANDDSVQVRLKESQGYLLAVDFCKHITCIPQHMCNHPDLLWMLTAVGLPTRNPRAHPWRCQQSHPPLSCGSRLLLKALRMNEEQGCPPGKAKITSRSSKLEGSKLSKTQHFP